MPKFSSSARPKTFAAGIPAPHSGCSRTTNIDVRKEAAYALGAQLAKPNLDAELLQAALKELHVCWLTQTDPEVQGLLLEALGVVQYEDAKQADDAQVFLVKESRGLTPKILGAVRGLEALFRLNPQFGVRDDARARLRELVLSGVQSGQTAANLDRIVRIKRSALMALQAAHDTDAVTMQAAATDSDWQMRRLAAGRLNLSDAAQAELARQLAVDPAFQVRYELLGPLGRQASSTGVCAPIVSLLKDESPAVVMRAMDALAASCTDLEDVTKMLEKTADLMSQPGDPAIGISRPGHWRRSRASSRRPPGRGSPPPRSTRSGRFAPWRRT